MLEAADLQCPLGTAASSAHAPSSIRRLLFMKILLGQCCLVQRRPVLKELQAGVLLRISCFKLFMLFLVCMEKWRASH